MKNLFLILAISINTWAHEKEIEQSAREKAKRYEQFLYAMRLLEDEDFESALQNRRKFSIPKIIIVRQLDNCDDDFVMLRKEDFD